MYLINNNNVRVIDNEAVDIRDKLPVGVYSLHFHPMQGVWLEKESNFNIPEKLYGSARSGADRIVRTYKRRDCNTGVLLSGIKGSGKTLTSKLVANELAKEGISTVLVNSKIPSDVLVGIVNDMNEQVCFLFDEFDKTYKSDNDGNNPQEKLLTMLDGTLSNGTKKLFIMTANLLYNIDSHLLDRPGRLYYHIEYTYLTPDEVEEYARDFIQDEEIIGDLRTYASGLQITYDILTAIIEELLSFECSIDEVMKFLNVSKSSNRENFYNLEIKKEGHSEVLHTRKKVKLNPLNPHFCSWESVGDKDEDGDRDDVYLTCDYSTFVDLDIDTGVVTFLTEGFICKFVPIDKGPEGVDLLVKRKRKGK